MEPLAIVAGVFIGLVGNLFVAWVFELGLQGDERATIARGIICVILSFIVSSALLFAAFALLADAFRVCGIAFVATAVVVLAIEAIRASAAM